MAQINDDTPMRWGKYKGTKMEDVPASYLLWLYDVGCKDNDVMHYIRENLDVLQKELKESKNYG